MSDRNKIIEEIFNKQFDSEFANVIIQSKNFIDQLIIEINNKDVPIDSTVKNLLNLKSFLESSLLEYNIKDFIQKKEAQLKKTKKQEKELEK